MNDCDWTHIGWLMGRMVWVPWWCGVGVCLGYTADRWSRRERWDCGQQAMRRMKRRDEIPEIDVVVDGWRWWQRAHDVQSTSHTMYTPCDVYWSADDDEMRWLHWIGKEVVRGRCKEQMLIIMVQRDGNLPVDYRLGLTDQRCRAM